MRFSSSPGCIDDSNGIVALSWRNDHRDSQTSTLERCQTFSLSAHSNQHSRIRKTAQDAMRGCLTIAVFVPRVQETASIRSSSYRGPSIPSDLVDRRVEITGPVSRKMIINALNSGARVFMGDLEDSTSPTWVNVIDGQINLRDAVNRSISLTTGGRRYQLNDRIATLMVRPRGWHLIEAHIVVDG
jgi:malate synthase